MRGLFARHILRINRPVTRPTASLDTERGVSAYSGGFPPLELTPFPGRNWTIRHICLTLPKINSADAVHRKGRGVLLWAAMYSLMARSRSATL
jgi:hypothetical protein